MRFKINFKKTKLDRVYVIEPEIFKDGRGSFVKVFHQKAFKDNNLQFNAEEVFYSESKKNVIRGMHFQNPPQAHAKIVYVVKGKIIDVVLDIREGSPTYGEFISVELSQDNKRMVYIPVGFVHGFSVISESATAVYMQTTMHSPKLDSGIRWDSFGMDWNIKEPILSERDRNFVKFADLKSPFVYKEEEK